MKTYRLLWAATIGQFKLRLSKSRREPGNKLLTSMTAASAGASGEIQVSGTYRWQ